MQNIWHDAFMMIMSYVKEDLQSLHLQLDKPDLDDSTKIQVNGKIHQLNLFFNKTIHWFSLANALALSILKHGEQNALDKVFCKHKSFDWMNCSEDFTSNRLLRMRRAFTSSRESTRDDDLPDFAYLGEVTIEEQEQLAKVEEKSVLVIQWIYDSLVIAHQKDIIQMPPPLMARVKTKISQGLQQYHEAYRIAAVPYPYFLAQMIHALMFAFLLMMPVVIEKFTQGVILTPVLSFLIAMSAWGLNQVAEDLENPFGEDENDLPLIEFCNMYIDRIMESTSACLRHKGQGHYRSVHDYAQVEILASAPPGLRPVKKKQGLGTEEEEGHREDTKGEVHSKIATGSAARARSAEPVIQNSSKTSVQSVRTAPARTGRSAKRERSPTPAWSQAKSKPQQNRFHSTDHRTGHAPNQLGYQVVEKHLPAWTEGYYEHDLEMGYNELELAPFTIRQPHDPDHPPHLQHPARRLVPYRNERHPVSEAQQQMLPSPQRHCQYHLQYQYTNGGEEDLPPPHTQYQYIT